MLVDKSCSRRLSILQAAFKSMSKKVLYRKGVKKQRPTGLWFKWHYQVFLFLKLQIKQEQRALRGQDLFTGIIPPLQSCKLLAQQVADGRGCGSRVRDRIMSYEVQWIKKQFIPTPGQGRHRKVLSLLEDPDTILAVRQYILHVGDSK